MEDSGAGAGAGAGAPLNTEDHRFTNMIQNHLLTVIMPARQFLTFLRVHLLSVPGGGDVPKVSIDGKKLCIRFIKLISSWGNHATAICYVIDKTSEYNTPDGTVTACLRFKRLEQQMVNNTVTNRYDSPQGVVQLVFPKLIEKVRDIMVLGNVPLNRTSWGQWTETITESVLGVLNNEGITQGRKDLEDKLAKYFERIHHALEQSEGDYDKQIQLREIRIKYCDLLLDLLRDDLLKNYGGNVQQGLLATINIGNNNDDYTTHNGKRITDSTFQQAAYNVLFLVNIDIGGYIYTVHMDIDRSKVTTYLESINR
jgi:hypothetical protein